LPDYGESIAQIVTGEPTSPWADIEHGLVKTIVGAKKYFYVQTPYFLPTEPILFALQTAALAGVDVRLMIPQKSDTVLPHLGTLSYLRDVLQAGVKVYRYKKGFLHSKLMVSDDALVTVGSTNMDFRSFEHNFEVNAFIYDKQLASDMKRVFIQDQADSEQVFLKEWNKRPWYERLVEGTVRLMAPLL
ncbi:MAG: cardiolipin synthase, partial [Bacteroidaceae bacterium]|nr:cardiolipin synthase [Bacteroidaceae bacterium]